MTKKTNLIITDNQRIFRESLRNIIEAKSSFQVIAEAEDGLSCLELVQTKMPDVVILDLKLPKLNGLNTISQLKNRYPKTKIFVLTASELPYVWQEVLWLGIHGIASKQTGIDELIKGLGQVIDGGFYASKDIEPHISEYIDFLNGFNTGPEKRAFTNRERQMIELVAEGYSSYDIAYMLGISDLTVARHRQSMRKKLAVTTANKVIRYAIDTGLVNWRASDEAD